MQAISSFDLTCPATSLRNRFCTRVFGAWPGRKPGTIASLRMSPRDSSNCCSTSSRGMTTFRCFLQGPTSLIWTSRFSFGLSGASGAVSTDDSGSCSAVLIDGVLTLGDNGPDGSDCHHAPDALRAVAADPGCGKTAVRGPRASATRRMEREMGFEPTTTTLATW